MCNIIPNYFALAGRLFGVFFYPEALPRVRISMAFSQNKRSYSLNCNKKPLEYLNQKINKDLNSEDTKIPTYIINDKVVDFKMFKALMSNVSFKQVHAFLILNDCKNLQELLDVDVSNGLVLIYTK